MHDLEVGERVADLAALVETWSAHHPIRQADADEAVLELAGLGAGAHQDGDRGQRQAAALQGLDLVADEARLGLAVPEPAQAHRLALVALGPEGLAEAPLVVGDQARGGGQDVRGRAVVALEPDHLGPGEVLFEAQDVADLGPAPAIDRLVVVADAAEIVVAAGEQAQPEVLGHVGVLVLVDQEVAELLLIAPADVVAGLEERQVV
jgi:hypothetical protein